MGGFVDLTGKEFGRLTVIKRVENFVYKNGKQRAQWLCECSCKDKNKIVVTTNALTTGNTRSCGCLAKEFASENGKNNKKHNEYDLSGEYGIGYTSNDNEFWFDLEDYDKIKDYCWYTNDQGYIISSNSDGKRVALHRLITDCPDAFMPDHIHGKDSRYDNRKSNLRIVNHSKNNMNKGLQSNNKSGVTGVSWHKLTNKWIAYIAINKKQIHLGSFKNFDDAVTARKQAEEKYFGEYSYDNSMKKESVA